MPALVSWALRALLLERSVRPVKEYRMLRDIFEE